MFAVESELNLVSTADKTSLETHKSPRLPEARCHLWPLTTRLPDSLPQPRLWSRLGQWGGLWEEVQFSIPKVNLGQWPKWMEDDLNKVYRGIILFKGLCFYVTFKVWLHTPVGPSRSMCKYLNRRGLKTVTLNPHKNKLGKKKSTFTASSGWGGFIMFNPRCHIPKTKQFKKHFILFTIT